MYYGGKDRGRDRSSDGSETPRLKEAGASQVRYVLRECEGRVKRDTQVTDTIEDLISPLKHIPPRME